MEKITSKLPLITISFWIMKICATTLGETAGDLMAQTMHVGYGVSSVILLTFFVCALCVQLFIKTYRPVIYWLVIIATSTAGTTMSDFMDRTLGLGYTMGSIILVSLLLVILAAWKATEKTLSVTEIRSLRAEFFYWSAILISNTLGTALGDFLADDSGLGFFGGALLTGSILALIVTAYYFTKISHIVLFWIAFVLTRPFGATLGDLLTKPLEKGGLNFGTLGSSGVLLMILIILVIKEVSKRQKQLSQAVSID
ncbi:MAG: COG4705 family protein [Bacteroidia bacterium]